MSGTEKFNELEKEVFSAISWFVSPLLAFEYNEKNDYYYTNETNGIQRHGGFMDLYDHLGPLLGMDLNTEILTFTPEGSDKEYRLQFWKGTYGFGLSYGAEIGFYSRNVNWAGLMPYEGNEGVNDWFDLYACVSGDDEIRTVQTLYDGNTGNRLLRNDTADYAEGGDHFWNLAIQSTKGYLKEDIVVVDKLYVSDPNMFDAMVQAIEQNENLILLDIGKEGDESFIKVQYGEIKKERLDEEW